MKSDMAVGYTREIRLSACGCTPTNAWVNKVKDKKPLMQKAQTRTVGRRCVIEVVAVGAKNSQS